MWQELCWPVRRISKQSCCKAISSIQDCRKPWLRWASSCGWERSRVTDSFTPHTPCYTTHNSHCANLFLDCGCVVWNGSRVQSGYRAFSGVPVEREISTREKVAAEVSGESAMRYAVQFKQLFEQWNKQSINQSTTIDKNINQATINNHSLYADISTRSRRTQGNTVSWSKTPYRPSRWVQ